MQHLLSIFFDLHFKFSIHHQRGLSIDVCLVKLIDLRYTVNRSRERRRGEV